MYDVISCILLRLRSWSPYTLSSMVGTCVALHLELKISVLHQLIDAYHFKVVADTPLDGPFMQKCIIKVAIHSSFDW